jgi:hypothetical protein
MNLTHKVFGFLRVLRLGTPRGRRSYWVCRCEARYHGKVCGVVKEVRSDALLAAGGTRSCGCLQREAVSALGHHHPPGERFSRLVIIRQAGVIKKRGRVYLCLCNCGQKVEVQGRHLRDGGIKSCGCYYLDTRTTNIKHGQARAKSATGTYRAYQRKRSLCLNPNGSMAQYFHDRGVEFRFDNFQDFFNEVGEKPHDDCWLVRIDPDGHFEPGNLTWREVKRHRRKRRRKSRSK